MNTKHATLIALILICIISCSRDRGHVVAEINGTPLYTLDVEQAMDFEKNKYDPALMTIPANADKLRRSALELMIQEALLLDEAKRLGITVTEDERRNDLKQHFGTTSKRKIHSLLKEHGIDPAFWMHRQKNKLMIRKLVTQEVVDKIPVSDEEISSYYKTHQDEFHRPLQYRARQILVETRELADDIVKQLKDGADFAELAKKHSISPDAERGGDLGFFNTKDFPHVFTEICAQLKKNEISEVKETEYGFQIFQLLDKRPAQTLSLDEVRDEVIDRIRDKRSAEAFAIWMEDIRSRGSVIINEKVLEEVNLHAQSAS